MNNYTQVGIWAGVFAAVFLVLWFTGNLVKLRNYVIETREELRKCTWPSWDELRGSTMLVVLSIFLFGAFAYVVDQIIFFLVTQMVKI